MSLIAVLPLACAVAAIWFWLYRAQPVLRQSGNRRAELVGLIVTVEAVLAQFVGIAVAANREVGTPGWWLWVGGGVIWIAILALGYPGYAWLLRVTRGNDPGDGS
ncbi:MAG TPA: hypothetical protein VKR24_09900 [Candidatus Limnocylindrales bacterium]|nr:hypothetical protein [Candidatus Limnocylindrales bacterium]